MGEVLGGGGLWPVALAQKLGPRGMASIVYSMWDRIKDTDTSIHDPEPSCLPEWRSQREASLEGAYMRT